EIGRVDIARLARAVNHDRPVRPEAEAREQRRVRHEAEQLVRHTAVGGPQLFDVQIYRPGDVRLEIPRVVVPHIDYRDVRIALGEERGELAAGGQARRLYQRGPQGQYCRGLVHTHHFPL